MQNWVANRVTATLSQKLHTKVSLQNIDFQFFNKLVLNGLLIEDLHKDTLLYAGEAKVNITDWFFLTQKPVIKYVGLNNAFINLNRVDSVWNYQFIADFLSGPKKTTSSAAVTIDFKNAQLKNVRVNFIDQWKGEDMLISVKQLDLSADDIDLEKKKIKINSLSIDKGSFAINEYTGNRPTALIQAAKIDSTQKYKWNNNGWIIDLKNIHLNNSEVISNSDTNRPTYTNHFDELHLGFAAITGDINNVYYAKDTVTANVLLSTKERCGFEVKKLQADIKFTPELLAFNQLDLITNKSRLGNFYSMKYKNFTDDMNSFLHKVTLTGNFEKCIISSDDLAFFAPELKSWKRVFSVSGTAKGTVDNISAKKMYIKGGNTIIDGDIDFIGLPDIDNTFIDFNSRNLQTNYADITTIIPAFKKITYPKLSKLGNIHYKGNFTGFINDFVAYGTISTNLGTVTADINMKFPAKKPVVYLGKISTNGFQLGQFLNVSQVGDIAFNGSVKGEGFDQRDLKANFDGNIKRIKVLDYTYQNIQLNGAFNKRLFTGTVNINDPNLKLDYLKGTIDLTKDQPKFNFDANLTKVDFKQLKLTKDSFSLAGRFNFDFTGSNIDDFLGTAKIYNATLLHGNKPLSFDSLSIQSQIIDDEKFIALRSNELDVSVTGKFKILALPDAFKVFLNHYYPSYISKPNYEVSDQSFGFSIKSNNIDNYLLLLNDKLQGFNNSIVSGSLRLKENKLNINATIPEFSYNGKIFNDVKLTSKGNLDTLVANIDAGDIAINDSLHFPSTNLVFLSHNDISTVSLTTSASQILSNASINAIVQTMQQGVKVNILPSSFVINDKKWQIENDGELTVEQHKIIANNIKFTQGNQQVIISTTPSDSSTTGTDILVALKKVSIGDIAPYLFKDPRLDGLLTGSIKISDPFDKPNIGYDVQAQQLRVDADSIGTLNSIGNYNFNTGIATFTANANNDKYQFDVDGTFNSKDSTGNQTSINIKTNKFNIGILNNYLGDIFSNMSGIANTSNLKISGNTNHLSITGTAVVESGSLIVNYTQCKYKFDNAVIQFNPDEINFGTLKLKDTLNNIATLTGKMYHRFFKDFEFDNLRFQSKNLLLLNTTKKDNTAFYGKIIGDAVMTIDGPIKDMVMNIDGGPSSNASDSNHLYLLTANSAENKGIDYIEFIQFGDLMTNNFKKSSSNLLVNMNVTANDACKVDVILDESTGDVIHGQGNGKLNIKVGSNEPLSIRGRYDITNGEYKFNFQTFFHYYFSVSSGTIVWTGDPYQANIDIYAQYLAQNVDLSSLPLASANTPKSDVFVKARLTETLLKPKINFQFKLPDNSASTNDFSVLKSFDLFAGDENEMNKQVTSVLLFNSFMSNTGNTLSAGGGYSVLTNTIGGVISNVLSNSFNKLLQKVLNSNTVSSYVDINSSTTIDNQLQGDGKFGIKKSFDNNRIVVSVGGNFDYNNPNAAPSTNGKSNNLLLTPDVTIEWILTKDGRVRLVGFNKTNYDLIVGERNRTGIKLTYHKDVDKLLNFFKEPKDKRKRKAFSNRDLNF